MKCPQCNQKMIPNALAARGSRSWDCLECNLAYIKSMRRPKQ